VTISGHSVGLPASLAFSNFYSDGVQGLGRVMVQRGSLLTEAQSREPGEMYAVLWKGRDGFTSLRDWVKTTHQEIWVACFNLETDQEAQVVLTVRQGIDIEKVLKDRFTSNIKRVIKLPIALGAHSPLVESAVRKFESFLNDMLLHGSLQSLNQGGTIFVSDHTHQEQIDPVASYDAAVIIKELTSLNEPVRFQRMIMYLVNNLGVTDIWEIGSDILTKMIREMGFNVNLRSINKPLELDNAVRDLANLGMVNRETRVGSPILELGVNEARTILEAVANFDETQINDLSSFNGVGGYTHEQIRDAILVYFSHLFDTHENAENGNKMVKNDTERDLTLEFSFDPYVSGVFVTRLRSSSSNRLLIANVMSLDEGEEWRSGVDDTRDGVRISLEVDHVNTLEDFKHLFRYARWTCANMLTWDSDGIILPEELSNRERR